VEVGRCRCELFEGLYEGAEQLFRGSDFILPMGLSSS
jgi:hypothetical protein